MHKLTAHSIGVKVWNWIRDWFSGREQRVVLLGSTSTWSTVKLWVPQGSVLGPVLFVIYLNDIDDIVSSKILKFADDTKLYRVVTNKDDIEILRSDLVNLCHWSKDWFMLFNVDKCKTLHIAVGNLNELHNIEGRPLESGHEERDLDIMITKDLKCSKQCLNAVKAANKILGMIKRTCTYKSEEIILQYC